MLKILVLFLAFGPLEQQVRWPQLDFNLFSKRFTVVEWGDLISNAGVNSPQFYILKDSVTKKDFIYIMNRDGSGSLQPYQVK